MSKAKMQWLRHEESHYDGDLRISYTSKCWPGWRIIVRQNYNRTRYYLRLEGTQSVHPMTAFSIG